MITIKKQNQKPDNNIIYMEVYGVNRVIYRVTSGNVRRRGKSVLVYGVSAEDIRTGYCESIENFSEDIETTLKFANSLVHKRVRPDRLYNEALRQLRFNTKGPLPM